MNQLTIRGFDEQLEKCLRQLAAERQISLNRAALELMRRGAGFAERRESPGRVGSALDTFIGVWSAEDELELRRALEPFEQIDPRALVVRVALDTSAYSALMRGHRDIASLVRRAEAVLLPAVVAGELLYGFRYGTRFEENAARLEAFLEMPAVNLLPVTYVTADRFGRIATALREKGAPIPTNDIWIAAQAMEAGADLVSSDAHFGQVEGLAWVSFPANAENSVRERVRRYHSGRGE